MHKKNSGGSRPQASDTGRQGCLPVHVLLAVCLVALISACGTRRMALPPSDAGSPLADAARLYEQVTKDCRDVRVITAEMGLSGRIDGRRVPRGRLQVGLAEGGRVRLLAVAPFGAPYFILAAEADRATLLLPRDGVYTHARSVEPLIEAMTGLPLGADDLRAILTGCVSSARRASAGRQHANEWFSLTLDDGAVLYGRRDGETPRIAAGRLDGVTVEYPDATGRTPRAILVVAEGTTGPQAELSLNVSQVEINRELPEEAFELEVPADARPITVDELRRAGPLRQETDEQP